MKKILVLIMILFLSACSLTTATTPKEKVSEYLDKYKNEHTNVIEQLKDTIEDTFTKEDYKKRYTTLMTNQYKSMEYKITDEMIEDNNAVVDVEVTVLNYGSSIKDSENYLKEHKDEFKKEVEEKTEDNNILYNDKSKDETTRDIEKDEIDEDKYMEYKLSQMEKVTDTVKYNIEFNLTKNKDGNWEIDDLSDSDLEKLHGIYVD